MKKKAFKIAAASAVAASAFAAMPAVQSNAASNVATTVSQAVAQMKNAYYTYSNPTAQGKFADIKAVYKQYNAAKTAYANAKAVVNKATSGKQKAAYLAQLDSNYSQYITNRVVTYIDAYNYSVNSLKANTDNLLAAITAKNSTDAKTYYNQLTNQLSRTAIIYRVYGQSTRNLFVSQFVAPAQSAIAAYKTFMTTVVSVSPINDIQVNEGSQPTLPATVSATYLDGSTKDVAVTWDASSLNINKAGNYTLTGSVAGTTLTASVKVVVVDKTAPVITLKGDQTVKVAYGTAYTDAGATATDNNDGTVAVTSVITDANGNAVSSIDGKTAGTYTVTYNATDAAGNKATPVIRTVVVENDTVSSVSAIHGVTSGNLTLASGNNTVTLQAKDANGNAITSGITWSSSDDSVATVNANGVVTAVKAGTATITATDSLGNTATYKVTILGAASSVQLTAGSNSFAADGATGVDKVTLSVVDAAGNALTNYNGPVQVYTSTSNIASIEQTGATSGNGTLGSPDVFTAVNGQVTITLDSTTTKGTELIYAGIPDASGNVANFASLSLSAVAPVPTSIVADPSTAKNITDVVAFSGISANFDLLDQNGKPITSGNYEGTVTISGPAEFGYTGSKTAELYFSNGVGMIPNFFTTSPSTTGSITLTPSVDGLTGTPFTINVYHQTANATQLSLSTQPKTTSFTADQVAAGTFQKYAVQATDANGLAAASAPSNLNVTVLGPDGNTSTAVSATATASGSGTYNVALALANGATKIPAGTYTVKIADATANTTIAPLTETFTVTAGKANSVTVTPSANPYDLPVANPSTTVSAQLVDAWGNKVAQSGYVVDFTGTGSFAPSVSQVATNADGIATVTANDTNTTPANGNNGTITAVIDGTWAANHNDATASTTPVSTGTLFVTSSQAAKINAIESSTSVNEGQAAPTITTSTLNSAGAPVTGDTLDWTLVGPTGFTKANGTVTAGSSIVGLPTNLTVAGTYTVTLTDESQPNVAAQTLTFTVKAGSVNGTQFFQNGTLVTNPVKVAANTPVALTIETVDSNNNPVTDSKAVTVSLTDNNGGGAFSLTQGGTPVTSVTIPAGQSGVTVYYVNATTGSYNLNSGFSEAQAVATLSSASLTLGTNQLDLVYSGPLTNGAVDKSQFVVTVNGNNDAVTNAQVVNGQVQLTLAANPASGQTVSVSYTPDTTAPVKDANGNVSAFSNQLVTLNVPAL